jgi:hypothetical protein
MTPNEIAEQIWSEDWNWLRKSIWEQTHNQVEIRPWFEVWGRFMSDPSLVGSQVDVQAEEDYDGVG